MKKIKKIVLCITILTGLLSFKLADTKLFEFSYPKRDNTTITLSANNFNKFTKEWRGEDYYYYSESKDGIICSILYYKLNYEEKRSLVDAPKIAIGGPDISPAYPFAYFSNYSNLKKYESNVENWGKPTDNFMFRQNDITEFQGIKMKQKHMYAYFMADKDLFVNIHLSKTDFTPTDSTAMRQILSSLTKKK
ncbi:hypothetical protein [Chryseobacterium gambrini]|uniref:Uncharacterized protein n=1 Tax=Chryseobacterium gambrini TaxID=373672 RepID=A0ABM8K652_9FLAO|nr:hypothetical protein CRDW_18640 [Chryseobacterium gambrini]